METLDWWAKYIFYIAIPYFLVLMAQDALAVLLDPDNLIQTRVTVTEGARVRDVIATIVALSASAILA